MAAVAVIGKVAQGAAKVAVEVSRVVMKVGAQMASKVGAAASKLGSAASTVGNKAGAAVSRVSNVAQAGPKAATAGTPSKGLISQMRQIGDVGKRVDQVSRKGAAVENKGQSHSSNLAETVQQTMATNAQAANEAYQGATEGKIPQVSMNLGVAVELGRAAFSAIFGGAKSLAGKGQGMAPAPMARSAGPKMPQQQMGQERNMGMAMAA